MIPTIWWCWVISAVNEINGVQAYIFLLIGLETHSAHEWHSATCKQLWFSIPTIVDSEVVVRALSFFTWIIAVLPIAKSSPLSKGIWSNITRGLQRVYASYLWVSLGLAVSVGHLLQTPDLTSASSYSVVQVGPRTKARHIKKTACDRSMYRKNSTKHGWFTILKPSGMGPFSKIANGLKIT